MYAILKRLHLIFLSYRLYTTTILHTEPSLDPAKEILHLNVLHNERLALRLNHHILLQYVQPVLVLVMLLQLTVRLVRVATDFARKLPYRRVRKHVRLQIAGPLEAFVTVRTVVGRFRIVHLHVLPVAKSAPEAAATNFTLKRFLARVQLHVHQVLVMKGERFVTDFALMAGQMFASLVHIHRTVRFRHIVTVRVRALRVLKGSLPLRRSFRLFS